MKAEDLRTKTPDELSKILTDLKKQQFNLRFQKSQGQLAQTAQMRAVRRNIARVMTFMGGKAAAPGARVKKAPKAASAEAPKKKTEKTEGPAAKKPAKKKTA